MKDIFDWLKNEFKERKSKCDKKSREILESEGYSENYRLFEGKSIGFRVAIEQVENAETKFSEKEREIRARAIEEFAEACKNHIFCQTFGLHPKTIDEIAKELKGE